MGGGRGRVEEKCISIFSCICVAFFIFSSIISICCCICFFRTRVSLNVFLCLYFRAHTSPQFFVYLYLYVCVRLSLFCICISVRTRHCICSVTRAQCLSFKTHLEPTDNITSHVRLQVHISKKTKNKTRTHEGVYDQHPPSATPSTRRCVVVSFRGVSTSVQRHGTLLGALHFSRRMRLTLRSARCCLRQQPPHEVTLPICVMACTFSFPNQKFDSSLNPLAYDVQFL